jgi:hypothetical protein
MAVDSPHIARVHYREPDTIPWPIRVTLALLLVLLLAATGIALLILVGMSLEAIQAMTDQLSRAMDTAAYR